MTINMTILKNKGIKDYRSKQLIKSSGSIKTKICKWWLALATLWYKVVDHQLNQENGKDFHFFIYYENTTNIFSFIWSQTHM